MRLFLLLLLLLLSLKLWQFSLIYLKLWSWILGCHQIPLLKAPLMFAMKDNKLCLLFYLWLISCSKTKNNSMCVKFWYLKSWKGMSREQRTSFFPFLALAVLFGKWSLWTGWGRPTIFTKLNLGYNIKLGQPEKHVMTILLVFLSSLLMRKGCARISVCFQWLCINKYGVCGPCLSMEGTCTISP